jgi:broad specificity phosphatase PhoE
VADERRGLKHSVARIRRLLLVRHGLPDYSTRKKGDEPPGPPLSGTGVDQIHQLVPLIRVREPVAVHSSPLARAWQSAEIVADALKLPLRIDSDLKEWHHTERLYQVNERSARWLRQWLSSDERCAVAFGHASPLLSIMRTALFLPHFGWWVGNNRDHLTLDTCDRFEVSMGSLFEIVFEPETVTARCLCHPVPRIAHYTRRRGPIRTFPRPTMTGENLEIRRPNFGRLIGYRP